MLYINAGMFGSLNEYCVSKTRGVPKTLFYFTVCSVDNIIVYRVYIHIQVGKRFKNL